MGIHNNINMPPLPDTQATAQVAALAFITRWEHNTASELATAQSFVIDLCALLGVDKPHPTPEQNYMFERPVTFSHGDGTTSPGRIDCYKRGHFVLEAKKLKTGTHTKGFDDGLLRAHKQGEGYARALPAVEGRPPFILVVDVGTVIEVFAEFSLSGGTYIPFPDPRRHRLLLADLARPEIRQRLRQIWLAPDSLNPARISAEVTREVAQLLAQLAKSLETNPVKTAQATPEIVAAFLTRCLFSMFAEDVELLPKGAFINLLKTHRDAPATLQHMLRILWADMDIGGFSAALARPVLKFNGKLFKNSAADGYSLLLLPAQIDLLIQAAQANWREVEPAIFGTLLERALDPAERHALGAHYTPRAYVERLVLPAVIEPLRTDWANAQAAALMLAHEAAELQAAPVEVKRKSDFASADRHARAVREKWRDARQLVKDFHHQLCTVRVLDPACGSGNFLYVTLEHLKRLEGEVLNQLADLGESQDALAFRGETVTLQQLRGIELNERAAALAELVLWIGYLQWHIRTQGNAAVAEPVVHDYGNIECRDAVLAWREQTPAYDAEKQLLTRWDGVTLKTHPVTGAWVPDEAAQVPQWHYLNPCQAVWPPAEFIVGNPPFIGAATMRAALGDGYVEALRGVCKDVPESADFVMYWWAHAAALVGRGQARRFGLITTNSLRQTFNRRVVQAALEGESALSLVFAIADHPWVDSANGAAVRIAMTVAARANPTENLEADADVGRLLTVTGEETGAFGEVDVTLMERTGLIHADLSIGANVTEAKPLQANENLSNRGVQLFGAGFIVTPEEAAALLPAPPQTPSHHHLLRDYRNGRDLTDAPRGVKVIDAFGLSADQLRSQHPAVYQWLLARVKPERDQNNRATYRDNWWIHGEPRKVMRKQLAGLPRYIATVETAKHRTFQFLDAAILPDNKLIAIASSDAFHLGVLSSRPHSAWALAAGSWLGVGNDPVYVKSRCFETFPFPEEDTGLTPERREKISRLAEQIDAHCKRVSGLLPSTPTHTPPATKATKAEKAPTLTALYNVLEALRQGRPLTAKEKTTHTQGLVSVLKDLHDELDTAVLQAYGWPDLANAQAPTQDQGELLSRLVVLNARRAAEEAQDTIRWLRPTFQNPPKSQPNQALPVPIQTGLALDFPQENPPNIDKTTTPETTPATAQPWPATLPEQVRAVAQVLENSPHPLTLSALEAHFKGRGPWKKSLPKLLQTLEAVGRAQRMGERWRGQA